LEEGFAVFIIVFVLIMVVFAIAYVVGVSRAKKKVGVFSQYIKQHFPEIGDQQFLSTSQASKVSNLSIALLIDEAQRRIIILQDVKGTGITHPRSIHMRNHLPCALMTGRSTRC